MSSQRYLKLAEFPAHAGEVRCVRIGRKTAGVLVTGGDDKKVNVWALGRTTASFSLAGHQSSVESVTFDNEEMVVAAGGANGSIKMFELQLGKVTKSLQGHKSNVTCLVWHPYNSTMISGSMDTNVKLWSLREKDAAMTFKGHNAGITHLRFSPDGNWVASASADGAVKLWDVRAGRLVVDLCQPSKHEVTGLEFSPTEYLMATAARDKVVRFWDLENFTTLGQTSPEATPVRNIAFHTDGRQVFSAVQDGFRVWSVEPTEPQDYVDVPWYRVSDLAVCTFRGQQRLIGCSFNSTMVGLFYVTLRHVRPFCEDPDFMAREQGVSVDGNPLAGGGIVLGGGRGLQAAAAAAQLPPENAMRRLVLNDRGQGGPGEGPARGEGPLRSDANGAGGPAGYPNGARAAPVNASAAASSGRPLAAGNAVRLPPPGPSAPSAALPPVSLYPTPPVLAASSSRYGSAAAAASQDFGGPPDHGPSSRPGSGYASGADRGSRPGSAQSASGASHAAGPSGGRAEMVSIGVGVGDSLMRGHLQPPEQPPVPPPRSRPTYNERQQREPAVEVRAPAYPPPRPITPPHQPSFQPSFQPSQGVDMGTDASAEHQRYPWQGPGQMGGPAGPSGGGIAYVSAGPSDGEIAASLSAKHSSVLGSLKRRAHSLTLIRNFVHKCDWRGAISCARRCGDPAAFADLLTVMHERRDAFSLDLVGEVASVVETVLSLPSDRQVQVALDVVSLMLRAFGPIIRELCGPGARGVGIDLSFEERRERASKARLCLQNIAPRLTSLARQSETLGLQAQDLASQLGQM